MLRPTPTCSRISLYNLVVDRGWFFQIAQSDPCCISFHPAQQNVRYAGPIRPRVGHRMSLKLITDVLADQRLQGDFADESLGAPIETRFPLKLRNHLFNNPPAEALAGRFLY